MCVCVYCRDNIVIKQEYSMNTEQYNQYNDNTFILKHVLIFSFLFRLLFFKGTCSKFY